MTQVPLPVPGFGVPLPGRGCDCAACAFWMGLDGNGGPATIEPLCSGTNSDCSYCGCARAEADAPALACARCPVRLLLLAAELAAAGVPAIPNLYWFRLEDLRRLVGWTADADPPAVAVNAQTVRENSAWDSWLLPGLCLLAENLPARTPVILTGLSRADRITTCAELFGDRLIVVSRNPYQYALHGAVMTAAGRRDVHARAADAFAATVRYMAALLPPRPGSLR